VGSNIQACDHGRTKHAIPIHLIGIAGGDGWVWGKYGSFVNHLLNRLTNISVFSRGHSSQNGRAQAHGF
jgi:hypothetical protein